MLNTKNNSNFYFHGEEVRKLHSEYMTFVCVWTETSAGLQKILQEIQPRDTNDFFTSARELDTHHGDDHTQTQTTHTPLLETGELEILTLRLFNIPMKNILSCLISRSSPILNLFRCIKIVRRSFLRGCGGVKVGV